MERRRKTMARGKKVESKPAERKQMRPALTPEARELQLISLAVDLAEKQLMEGTASAQVITHYLKLGSSKEKLEKEKLEEENKLLRAKTKAVESSEEIKALYADAVKAMQRYSGAEDEDEF
jgi:hypothetical protein